MLVIPELFPTGKGNSRGIFITDYLKSIEGKCDYHVYYPRLVDDREGKVDAEFDEEYNVTRFSLSTTRIQGWKKVMAYRKWLKEAFEQGKEFGKVDVIHVHGPALQGVLGLKLAKYYNAKLIVSVHTGPFSTISDNFLLKRMASRAMRKANKTLTVSDHTLQEIRNTGIAPKNVEVSGNPVDTSFFALDKSISRKKNFLFLSRLDEFKGGLRTVNAFHEIADKTDWNLVVAGDGEETKAIENYIESNQLQSRITFIQHIQRKGMKELFQQSCVLVFPSRHESFGLVPIEAMACGMPVVITNQTAPPENVNDSVAVKVNPDSVDEIAEGMLRMANNYTSYNQENIHNFVVEKFGLNTFGEKLMRIYREVLE